MNHPKPLNNRLDFLKDERPQKPPPTRKYPYKTSNYQRFEERSMSKDLPIQSIPTRPLPKNDRFQFLKVSDSGPPPVKKGLVAMCSRKQWEEGYRPGWILRNECEPPENYDIGLKMYKHYVQTGEIIFPKTKIKGDKAKQVGTSYMNKMSKRKGN